MRAEIVRCDTCTKDWDAQYCLPDDWVTITGRGKYIEGDDQHFCSKICLIKWASIGIASVDVDVVVNAVRNNGETARLEYELNQAKRSGEHQ
jgi:hypothetical protein